MNRILSEALSNGATEAVMEVSSHALAQQRVYGIPFDVAVFTNLTRDHLDYHHTMEEYFAAKQVLFEGCGTDAPRAAVINIEDEYGKRLVEVSRKRSAEVLTYGLAQGDFHAEKTEITSRGTRFDLLTPERNNPRFFCLDRPRERIQRHCRGRCWLRARLQAGSHGHKALSTYAAFPADLSAWTATNRSRVVVDYAHTDDALRNLTALAREFVRQAGHGSRVITVFGCGGDRDRAKRPLMGEAAGRGSDFVVLTSDNPRSEDPLAIINDAMVGLQRAGAKYTMEPDRRAAIAMAIAEAGPGDIVLIAGKGHEKVQVTREGARPFDDVEVAHQVLQAAGYSCEAANAAAGKNA